MLGVQCVPVSRVYVTEEKAAVPGFGELCACLPLELTPMGVISDG